jgi:hypothetical protein
MPTRIPKNKTVPNPRAETVVHVFETAQCATTNLLVMLLPLLWVKRAK